MSPHKPTRPFLRLVGESEDFAHGAWRADRNLVITHGATLPDRCIVCNAPAEGNSITKTLIWHTPMLLPLLVFVPVGLIIYAVLAFLFKRTLTTKLPLCAHHRRRRQVLSIAGLAMLPAFFILAAIGITINEPALIPPGIVLSLVGIVVLLFARNEIWPIRISDDHAHVRGANSEWLEGLPPWVEPGT